MHRGDKETCLRLLQGLIPEYNPGEVLAAGEPEDDSNIVRLAPAKLAAGE